MERFKQKLVQNNRKLEADNFQNPMVNWWTHAHKKAEISECVWDETKQKQIQRTYFSAKWLHLKIVIGNFSADILKAYNGLFYNIESLHIGLGSRALL